MAKKQKTETTVVTKEHWTTRKKRESAEQNAVWQGKIRAADAEVYRQLEEAGFIMAQEGGYAIASTSKIIGDTTVILTVFANSGMETEPSFSLYARIKIKPGPKEYYQGGYDGVVDTVRVPTLEEALKWAEEKIMDA